MVAATRWVLGPAIAFQIVAPELAPEPSAPAAPAEPPKLDVEVSYEPVAPGETLLRFTVPPYSLDTHNRLCEMRLYALPAPGDPPSDVASYLDGHHPFNALDLSDVQAGMRTGIGLPPVAPGMWFGRVLLGFDR